LAGIHGLVHEIGGVAGPDLVDMFLVKGGKAPVSDFCGVLP
jgi:hypothetical protein